MSRGKSKKAKRKATAIAVVKPLCGALTRNPETKSPTCRRPAGWGTDHAGQGRCKLHGGSSPITTGRFSSIQRPRLKELIEAFEKDPDPLNVLPELAAARALFVDFIERYDEWREALLAWFASWDTYKRPIPPELGAAFGRAIDEYENLLRENAEPTPAQLKDMDEARKLVKYMSGEELPTRPRLVLDVSAAMQHVDTISKIIKREQDSRADNAISRRDLIRVQSEMAKAVLKRVTAAVPDGDVSLGILQGIRTDWLEIHV